MLLLFMIYMVFVTEVKCLLSDKVKLGNQMKDSLDKMVDDGIESADVVICGLLVQGRSSLSCTSISITCVSFHFAISSIPVFPIHNEFAI